MNGHFLTAIDFTIYIHILFFICIYLSFFIYSLHIIFYVHGIYRITILMFGYLHSFTGLD